MGFLDVTFTNADERAIPQKTLISEVDASPTTNAPPAALRPLAPYEGKAGVTVIYEEE